MLLFLRTLTTYHAVGLGEMSGTPSDGLAYSLHNLACDDGLSHHNLRSWLSQRHILIAAVYLDAWLRNMLLLKISTYSIKRQGQTSNEKQF